MDDFAQIIERDMTQYLKSTSLNELTNLANNLSQDLKRQYDTGIALILIDVIKEILRRKKKCTTQSS